PTTGSEGMIGETGEVLADLNPAGSVRVHGEIWTAESASGFIEQGAKIRVVEIHNLTLRVERLS
ncbi:MAG TPA: NfeD family protein, partial [Bacteroidota bacterium]|nr:NfeD family protein [Bacteroidota bacterium]